MTSSEWKSHEDVEKDLWLFSEISGEDDMQEPTPDPILQYNARRGVNDSIFDTDHPLEEVTYLSSGRGRGCVSKIFKPGHPVKFCPDDEEDIKRRLREVSGLGYSNELIEKRFKITVPSPSIISEKEFCDIPEENEYQSEKIAHSSPTIFMSPKKQFSRISSPSLSSASSSPMREQAAPMKEKTTENWSQPLPLSQILRKAKQNNVNISKKEEQMDNGTKTSSLRPNAPEFKYTPRSSLESIKDTWESEAQSLEQASSNNQLDQITISDTTLDTSSSSSSIVEELSWRREGSQRSEPFSSRFKEFSRNEKRNQLLTRKSDNKTFPLSWRSPTNGSYSDGERSNGYRSEDDYPYRQATLYRKENGNCWRSDKVFDIHSNSDFPTLH